MRLAHSGICNRAHSRNQLSHPTSYSSAYRACHRLGQEKYLLYVLKPTKKLNIEAMWMKIKRGITFCTTWNPIYFLAINCSIFDLRFDIAQSVIHWGFDMNEKKQKEWSFHVRSKAKVLYQFPLRSSIYHDIKRNNFSNVKTIVFSPNLHRQSFIRCQSLVVGKTQTIMPWF